MVPIRLSSCLFALLLVLGCSPAGPTVGVPPPASTTPPAPTTVLPASSTTSTTEPAADACPEGDVMVSDGRLLQFERGTSDGTTIGAITWRRLGDCLRFTIDFVTDDGAPATTPPTLAARLLREAGVLRIETAATASVVTDQLVEDEAVGRLFVPITADGSRFVDLALTGPVVARARVLTSPARMELELAAGGEEAIGRPLMTPSLIVVEPGQAATMETILDLTGYTTGNLDPLTVTILRGEELVTEAILTPTSVPGSWTVFEMIVPVGDEVYDNMRLTAADGSLVAGIPFTP